MNRHFVCVLIDKEVRPDLDHTYMEAIRMFDQSPVGLFMLFAYRTEDLSGEVHISQKKILGMESPHGLKLLFESQNITKTIKMN